MATSLKELIVTFEANSKPVINALNQVDAKLKHTTRSLNKIGQSFTGLGKTMSLGLSLPILALTGLSVKAASDAEEILNKFAVVFSSVGNEADKVGRDLAKAFGLSQVKAQGLLADTGDLLTGFGFAGKAALELAKKTNELAVDLASFTNYSGGAEGASKALTKALLGERESVKELGIAILEEDVKKEVAILRSQGMTFASEREAKAIATLEIAYRQSQNAIGDYARTSSSYANQMRLFNARLFDVRVSLGKLILPSVTKYLIKFSNFISFLTEDFDLLDDKGKKILLTIGGLFAILGPGLLVLGTAIRVFAFSLGGLKAITFLLNPFRLLFTTIIGLVVYAYKKFEWFRRAIKYLGEGIVSDFQKINAIFNEIGNTIDRVMGKISSATGKIGKFFGLNKKQRMIIGQGSTEFKANNIKRALSLNPSSGAKASMSTPTVMDMASNKQSVITNNNLTVNIPANMSSTDGANIKNFIKQALQEENRQSYIELGTQ